jgi:hypothetical protein
MPSITVVAVVLPLRLPLPLPLRCPLPMPLRCDVLDSAKQKTLFEWGAQLEKSD